MGTGKDSTARVAKEASCTLKVDIAADGKACSQGAV
jgi:hypothetical protein